MIYQSVFSKLVDASANLIELELKGEAWKTAPNVTVVTPTLPDAALQRQSQAAADDTTDVAVAGAATGAPTPLVPATN